MKINKHKKQFGNQAENYTKYRKAYDGALYAKLEALLPSGSDRILDVACGTGKSTEPLIEYGLGVFGVDHDPLMVAEAKAQADLKNLHISYVVGEAEHLPFADEYFDVVTVGTAFHWFVNDVAIKELKRVLKKDGLLFIYWTMTTKDVPESDSIPHEIFRTFNWERVPLQLRDLGYIASFLEQNGMSRVQSARIPFFHDDTVDDQVGLMKTASSYEILSDEDKLRFVDMLTEALTAKLGERDHFTYEEEIQICYGYK